MQVLGLGNLYHGSTKSALAQARPCGGTEVGPRRGRARKMWWRRGDRARCGPTNVAPVWDINPSIKYPPGCGRDPDQGVGKAPAARRPPALGPTEPPAASLGPADRRDKARE